MYYDFYCLCKLLQQLGLTVNRKNLVPPSTTVDCLVIMINTDTRTMLVPPKKLSDIIDMSRLEKQEILV